MTDKTTAEGAFCTLGVLGAKRGTKMDDLGDDCGRLARMVVESMPPINADAAHRCISPACGTDCSDCSGALKPAAIFRYAKRYAYLRGRHLDAINAGGVFAGMTPDNVVLNGEDLDAAVDAALAELLVNTEAQRSRLSAELED